MKRAFGLSSVVLEPLVMAALAAVAVVGTVAAFRLSGRAQASRNRAGFWWLGAAGFVAAYWLTAVLGLQWAAVDGAASPIWPAAGVGLAGLLLGGMRLWPGILIARLAAALTTGSDQPWWAELFIALGNVGSAVLPALVLTHWSPIDHRLTAMRDVLRLALAVTLGAGLAAIVGVATLSLSAGLGTGAAREIGIAWWLGTTVGMLVITPLVLSWSYRAAWKFGPWGWLGLGMVLVVATVICHQVFFGHSREFLLAWYAYPVLILAAVAYQVRGVSLALLIVTVAAVWSATIGTGPFTLIYDLAPDRISLAQQFTTITALSSLILAAAADERRGIEALDRSEARESSIVNTAVDPIIVIDERANIVSFNPAAERTFGYGAGEVLGENVKLLMPEPYRSAHDRYLERYHQTGERRIIGIGRRVNGLRKNGTTFPLDLSVAEWRSGGNRFYTGIIHEQTESAKAEAALRASELRLSMAIEASGAGVYEQGVPATTGLHVTPQWLAILGYDTLPIEPEGFEEWLIEQVHPNDRDRRRAAFEAFVEGRESRLELEVRKRHASGRWIWVRSYAQAMNRDENGKVLRLSGMMLDITQRKAAARQVEHLAHHDTLTGLPNRALFAERLAAATARADLAGSCTGLVLIDLDDFKAVNDTLGHHAGDALLRIVTERITGSIRAGDTAARLGGDEFAVILPDVRSSADSEELARRISQAVVQPASIEGQTIEVTASLGVATYPDHAENVNLLMRHADLALYEAKEREHDRVFAFQPALGHAAGRRARLATELREAIAREELVLHYQPQFSIETGQISSVEALVRWPCQGALFPPGEFIPIAEKSGIIRPLGAWVIGEACRQQARWRALGYDLTIAVNVSPVEANTEDFITGLDQSLGRSGARANKLEFEITEGLLIDPQKPSVRAFLNACQERGIGLAIDDFGTGYSSLGYLGRLPISKVKIDRSFVSKIGHSEDDALIEAIVTLGRRLGKRVVAEGVETPSQLDYLKSIGCEDAQGYLLCAPLDAGALGAFLQDRLLNPRRHVRTW